MVTVIRADHAGTSSRGGHTFTGDVWKDSLLPRGECGIGIANIHLAPGARTHWHTHEGGQLLIVLAGQGLIGDADGAHLLHAGDMAWTNGGTAHWHGAVDDRYLLHTAISVQGVEWHGVVEDAAYVAAVEEARQAASAERPLRLVDKAAP